MMRSSVWFLANALRLPSPCILRALHSCNLSGWDCSGSLCSSVSSINGNLLQYQPLNLVLITSLSCSYNPIACQISPNSIASKIFHKLTLAFLFQLVSCWGQASASSIFAHLLSYCQTFTYFVSLALNASPLQHLSYCVLITVLKCCLFFKTFPGLSN